MRAHASHRHLCCATMPVSVCPLDNRSEGARPPGEAPDAGRIGGQPPSECRALSYETSA
jgi:hypothetical protein